MRNKNKRIPPLVRRAERVGIKKKSNGIPGKTLVGYKIAAKMKSDLRQFFINHRMTAKQSRDFYYKEFQIDWNNPNALIW